MQEVRCKTCDPTAASHRGDELVTRIGTLPISSPLLGNALRGALALEFLEKCFFVKRVACTQ
jgi:hypothetical protein